MKPIKTKLAPGIWQDAYGIDAEVRVGTKPHQLSDRKRFALDTKLSVMKHWQEAARVRLRPLATHASVRGTYAADWVVYLDTAKLTPERKKERTQHGQWWCAQKGADGKPLGRRARHTITAAEYQRALIALSETKKSGTVMHYRTSASNLYTVLDGKRAPNPILENVTKFESEPALPRGLDYSVVQTILAHVSPGWPKRPSKSHARLHVLAYAPLTPAQLKRSEPGDEDLDGPEPSILVRGRRKGKGAAPVRKPLMPPAVEAFRRFREVDAWAHGNGWSNSALHRIFIAARDLAEAELRQIDPTVDLSQVRPYDLRHSFGSLIYAATGSDSDTGKLLDHQDARTTNRYTLNAVPPRLLAASRAAALLLARVPARVPPAPGIH